MKPLQSDRPPRCWVVCCAVVVLPLAGLFLLGACVVNFGKMKSLLTILLLSAAASAFGASFYYNTNAAGEAVLYYAPSATWTNGSSYAAKGFVVTVTNYVAAATTQLDPSTNVWTRAYYLASQFSGSNDGATITTAWNDQNGVGIRNLTPSSTPTKETVSGKTVVRLDGVLDKFYSQNLNWKTNYGFVDYGCIVARIRPAANTQSMLFSWSQTVGDQVIFWTPYDGVIYFDWDNSANGRVQANLPANWTNNWHTVVVARNTSGGTYGTLILRVDGVTLATAVLPGTASIADTVFDVFVLGARPDAAANFWAGDIAGLAFFQSDTNNIPLTDLDKYGEWIANH